MDFSKVDIPRILEEAIPNRFQDMTPDDFEHFIAQLFRDRGFQAEVTGYIGDYGNDITLTDDDGTTTAVQVKRYSKGNNVSVPDVNQVLGGMQRYRCDKAMVVTTSDFTKPARSLEEQGLVSFVDWKELEVLLSSMYLDGKSHYEYYQEPTKVRPDDGPIKFRFQNAEYNSKMDGARGLYTLVYFELENVTSRNLDFKIRDLPVCITHDKRQVDAKSFLTGFKPSGKFYAGVKQHFAFWVDSTLLPEVKLGAKFIIKYKVDDKKFEEVYEWKVGGDIVTDDGKQRTQTVPSGEIPPTFTTHPVQMTLTALGWLLIIWIILNWIF